MGVKSKENGRSAERRHFEMARQQSKDHSQNNCSEDLDESL